MRMDKQHVIQSFAETFRFVAKHKVQFLDDLTHIAHEMHEIASKVLQHSDRDREFIERIDDIARCILRGEFDEIYNMERIEF